MFVVVTAVALKPVALNATVLCCVALLIHSYIIHEVLIKSTQGPKFSFVPDYNPNRFISSTRLQFKHFLNNLEPIYYFLLVYDRQIDWN